MSCGYHEFSLFYFCHDWPFASFRAHNARSLCVELARSGAIIVCRRFSVCVISDCPSRFSTLILEAGMLQISRFHLWFLSSAFWINNAVVKSLCCAFVKYKLVVVASARCIRLLVLPSFLVLCSWFCFS